MNPAFMREAIRVSVEMMRANQGGPFGAVVVRGDQIVGRGWNQVLSRKDPTAHAEIMAIRAACEALQTFKLDECEIYMSCEPCPICLSAIYWARLTKGYYGNTRSEAQEIGFDDAFIFAQMALPLAERKLVLEPCLREEALKAFLEWKGKLDKVGY